MKFLLLAFLFSFNLLAEEQCSQTNFAELQDIKDLNAALDWHAASDDDIEKAPCTEKSAPTRMEMTSWLASNQSSPNINKSINGIAFENESIENLEAFRHLTTFVDIMGYKDPAKHKDFTSRCKKVDCAINQIFGTDTGLQLLYMQRRFGMNGSHIVRDGAAAWKKEELDDVLLSLSDFPQGVLPFQETRPLIHAPRNQSSGRTLANAIVTIFDLWGTETAAQRRATVTHELGHAIAGVTDADDNPDWNKLSGWTTTSSVEKGKTVTSTSFSKKGAIVSEYGQTNPHEDLAEAVVAYRYNPTLLKNASPEKYNMLKSIIFDDVEYTSEAACTSPKRISVQLKTKIADKVKNWAPTSAELKSIANRCSQRAVEDLLANGSMDLTDNYFKNCYEQSVKKQTVEFLKAELKGMPYEKFLEPMIRNAMSEVPAEKVQEIASKAAWVHKKAFRETIANTVAEEMNCRPDFIQYGSLKFTTEEFGFSSYYYRDGLNNVIKQACDAKKNKSFQVNQLIK